jgi:uncharacterized membrane protein
MGFNVVIGFLNLFFVGILAGEEFTILSGVRRPLARLEDSSHIRFRQALIYRLRILVPAIFGLAICSGIAATILNGFDSGFGFRCAGLLALLAFIMITLFGTVPINAAALDWHPGAPPANWRTLIRRWELLDNVRCGAAVLAFALFLIGMALQ